MMFEAGQQFAHFEVIRKIGEGGMGEVYLVKDKKLNREVALKILHSEFFDSTERMERFNREAKTAAQISHSNVMAIHDIDSAKDKKTGKVFSYIVLEYIKGESLTDYLQNRNLTMTQLMRVAEKIAAGLVAAHKLDIVHRDIKTDNIKIDENGEPKILDFGLAKPIGPAFTGTDDQSTDTVSRQLTVEGKILGTLTYMSPEQARGEKVDTRSDIFSYGILLYRMFTREFPFEGPDRVSVLAKILEAKHTPVRQKNEAIPAELERIIDKCLQKDANDRYQDTRDLVVDLRSLRRQYQTQISDSDSTMADAPAAKTSGKHWFSPPLKIGFAVILVAILAIAALQFTSESPDRSADDTTDILKGLEGLGERINEQLRASGIDPVYIPGLVPHLHARESALAILGFENKTGDEDLDWLQAGLPEILLTDLAESAEMDLISRSRILDCLSEEERNAAPMPSHAACVHAATSLGASKVLSGSFFKMGDMIRIDARLEEVETGRIVLGEKVVGSDPFLLVDSLTRKIAGSLHVEEKMAADAQVAEITSSSPEAYKHYILGVEKSSLFLWDEAIVEFEKAIEIDTSFALPYMRIGIAYALRGRDQGRPYFAKAKELEDKLPTKDRNLLDIYSELWLRSNYDAAFSKMQTFMDNYPEDKEARAFYAIFLHVLKRETESAIAQLDTVLMLDPKYSPAFLWYCSIYESENDYDNAIKYAKRWKELYPDVPVPYTTLMTVYYSQGKLDETIAEAESLLEILSENAGAITTLVSAHTRLRNFSEAMRYIEQLREYHSDDPYRMITYYQYKANLAFWSGKFTTGIGFTTDALNKALETGDSAYVSVRYQALADYSWTLGLSDSVVAYGKRGYDWAVGFHNLNYPLLLVTVDPGNEPEARVLLEKATENFRSSVPSELWGIMNAVENIFDARCESDTAKLVMAYEELIANQTERSAANLFEYGMLLVLAGQYESGKEVLESMVTGGDEETAQAIITLFSLYYIGVANEALGNSEEAIANYREVLKYWGEPEIELKEIADIRERLERLVS